MNVVLCLKSGLKAYLSAPLLLLKPTLSYGLWTLRMGKIGGILQWKMIQKAALMPSWTLQASSCRQSLPVSSIFVSWLSLFPLVFLVGLIEVETLLLMWQQSTQLTVLVLSVLFQAIFQPLWLLFVRNMPLFVCLFDLIHWSLPKKKYYVRHECFLVEMQPHVTTLMLWLQLDMEFGVAKVDYILAPPWLHEFVKYFACIGE